MFLHIFHLPIIYVPTWIFNLNFSRDLSLLPNARYNPSTFLFQGTLSMEGIFLKLTLVLGSIFEANETAGSNTIGILAKKVLSGLVLNFGIAMKLAVFPLALDSISVNVFDLFE